MAYDKVIDYLSAFLISMWLFTSILVFTTGFPRPAVFIVLVNVTDRIICLYCHSVYNIPEFLFPFYLRVYNLVLLRDVRQFTKRSTSWTEKLPRFYERFSNTLFQMKYQVFSKTVLITLLMDRNSYH